MGIPSYYSYIIKNHSAILKKLATNCKFHYLYIDSNSIIYDEIKNINYNNSLQFEKALIESVCKKLLSYISLFNKPNNIIISFDGVAPLAKLNQQRSRRYKSQFTNSIIENFTADSQVKWNTAAITPGTNFMAKLDNKVKLFFKKYNNVIVFGSDTPGEGEHKICKHIRDNCNYNDNILIYGLDADLIMLGLNHLNYCKNIFLYRETPTYISNLNSDLDINSHYIFDINSLSNDIIFKLTNDTNFDKYKNKIYDYTFLSFMLGNDFMPHFPAINIRTHGIDILLDIYAKSITKEENIFDGKTINWKLFRKIVHELSINELNYIINDYKERDSFSRKYLPNNTSEEKERKFLLLPTRMRQDELYINPFEPYWENRYYKILFNIEINDEKVKTICKNYLEGLEWNSKYYCSDCPDWRWSYNYNYPPLLIDLIKCVPYYKTDFVKTIKENPVNPLVQLAYVSPKPLLPLLLPKSLFNKIKDKDWYSDNFTFTWAFCKYFWESHVNFTPINIHDLESIVH